MKHTENSWVSDDFCISAENRALIRELEGVSRLIDFVAHPEWNDLHVQAVMVLSSLLEDTESLEVVLYPLLVDHISSLSGSIKITWICGLNLITIYPLWITGFDLIVV